MAGRRKKTDYGFAVPKEAQSEYRRLVQNANRRIARATEAYEKAGMLTAPKRMTGGIDIREKWFSEKYALDRQIYFNSEQEYLDKLKFLREFDPKEKKSNPDYRPSVTEYAQQERVNTAAAIENVLGIDSIEEAFPDPVDENGKPLKDKNGKKILGLASKIKKMTATELTAFWKAFTKKAQKMGVKYASVQAMEDTLREFFPEDMAGFDSTSEHNNMITDFKRDMMSSKKGL
jgi:hypothetical protein